MPLKEGRQQKHVDFFFEYWLIFFRYVNRSSKRSVPSRLSKSSVSFLFFVFCYPLLLSPFSFSFFEYFSSFIKSWPKSLRSNSSLMVSSKIRKNPKNPKNKIPILVSEKPTRGFNEKFLGISSSSSTTFPELAEWISLCFCPSWPLTSFPNRQ